MAAIDTEAEWVANLVFDQRLRFLASLACGITIAGRHSYEVGTDDLINPRQLRRVNEIQHRVVACLSQLLHGTCPDGFAQSIATWVLAESDTELRGILEACWSKAKTRLKVD